MTREYHATVLLIGLTIDIYSVNLVRKLGESWLLAFNDHAAIHIRPSFNADTAFLFNIRRDKLFVYYLVAMTRFKQKLRTSPFDSTRQKCEQSAGKRGNEKFKHISGNKNLFCAMSRPHILSYIKINQHFIIRFFFYVIFTII